MRDVVNASGAKAARPPALIGLASLEAFFVSGTVLRGGGMCKTIKQRVKFKADPATVYDLLADSRKHSALTGKQAIISRKIGGTFTIGDDDVTGINVDLVPGRRIVQAWRHRRFPEGVFSMAAVALTPTPDGGTQLVLVHRGVPKELIAETEQAWRDQYWSRIKTYLDGQAGPHRGARPSTTTSLSSGLRSSSS